MRQMLPGFLAPSDALIIELLTATLITEQMTQTLQNHVRWADWNCIISPLCFLYFCSSVALNFQTAGLEMDLNDGLFRQNGCCGFVLKPDFLRDAHTEFSPERPETQPGYKPLRLSIQVHSDAELAHDSTAWLPLGVLTAIVQIKTWC